jgi:Predicted transcriptional regulators
MSQTAQPAHTAGQLIRYWRTRRRLSQLDCALDADISQRHLSFIESGRSKPSRAMVERLAEMLDVPMRERNALLVAAGYAPTYQVRDLDHPEMAAARRAIELVLSGAEPYPALVIDRHWTLVRANAAVERLLSGVTDPTLLEAPVNVLKLSLAPGGLAPQIANLGDWAHHLFTRLKRQIQTTGDARLSALLTELATLVPPAEAHPADDAVDGLVVPLELDTPFGRLSFISTTTVFGTPLDVTLAELAIEMFFPADDMTAALLRKAAQAS